MNKDVSAVIMNDKTESLFFIKPLHGPFFHCTNLLSKTQQKSQASRHWPEKAPCTADRETRPKARAG
jgi:hypothetical protein